MTEFESEESEQDFIITCKSNIEIIYKASANDDEIVRVLGMKNMCLKFCKYLLNDRLDEIEGSSEDSFKVYFIRLRGKHRNGHFGEIFNVQGIISRSQWDIMESKLKEITDEDEDYDCPQSVISYRLTREELFGKLQIDSVTTAINKHFKTQNHRLQVQNDEFSEEVLFYISSLHSLYIILY